MRYAVTVPLAADATREYSIQPDVGVGVIVGDGDVDAEDVSVAVSIEVNDAVSDAVIVAECVAVILGASVRLALGVPECEELGVPVLLALGVPLAEPFGVTGDVADADDISRRPRNVAEAAGVLEFDILTNIWVCVKSSLSPAGVSTQSENAAQP